LLRQYLTDSVIAADRSVSAVAEYERTGTPSRGGGTPGGFSERVGACTPDRPSLLTLSFIRVVDDFLVILLILFENVLLFCFAKVLFVDCLRNASLLRKSV
jgi:hypothetical protein